MACARTAISSASKGRRLIYPRLRSEILLNRRNFKGVSFMYKTSLLNSTGSEHFRITLRPTRSQKLRAGKPRPLMRNVHWIQGSGQPLPSCFISKMWSPDKHRLIMLMDIERPFMEEPFVPEQWNDPPEIPDKG